jgi:hypothetical protein
MNISFSFADFKSAASANFAIPAQRSDCTEYVRAVFPASNASFQFWRQMSGSKISIIASETRETEQRTSDGGKCSARVVLWPGIYRLLLWVLCWQRLIVITFVSDCQD